MSINYGVPQGSILGPILFILYINDLPLSLNNCLFDMYADDSTLHCSGKDIIEIKEKVQDDLNNVEKWCAENAMFINCAKTKTMTIGTRQKLLSIENEVGLMINGEYICNSENEKLLGIYLDQCLTWETQINQVCSKISSRLYNFSKIKKFLNLDCRKLFYNGYILPLIDYCCVVWGNCNECDLNRILKLQKRAARLILNKDCQTPSEPLFKKLGIMTVHNRIKYHKCILVYKCLNKLAPNYLCEKISYRSEVNPYPLRNVEKGDLNVPKPKRELLKMSFSYSGPFLWNTLPESIRKSPSVQSFSSNIKSYLTQN